MTFMEMIQGLDEKHRARRESCTHEMSIRYNGKFYIIDYHNSVENKLILPFPFTKDDFLATDWILEEVK